MDAAKPTIVGATLVVALHGQAQGLPLPEELYTCMRRI